MSALLQQLNREMGDVVEEARRGLVQVKGSRRGSGAGTIWHPDGLIITNAHVVRSKSPQVVLPDGTTRPARLLASDASKDVAALSVEASGLPTIQLGDSRLLQPGQWVMSLGHPWGVLGAATGGVVIGTGTDLPEMPLTDREWVAVSLHLRPGHSGGPLVDAAGRLVGVNTMMVGLEVGMAVPVHVIKDFLKQELRAPVAA
ncbi:MAG: S1C family serine protease [Dehalococcoidia bacterium]